MTGRNSFCKRPLQSLLLAVVGLMMVCSGSGLALDLDALAQDGMAGAQYVPLEHLSKEQGRTLLSKLGLGTAAPMPGANSLLVTASPEELAQALAVLDVADTLVPCQVRTLSASSLPSEQQLRAIEAALGNVSIGTFADRTPQPGKLRALVLSHNGSVAVVAPKNRIDDVVAALTQNAGATASPSLMTPVQSSAMLESNFNSLHRAAPKRVEEIRLQPAGVDDLPGGIARPQVVAPRSSAFDLAEERTQVSSLPVPPVPAAFAQLANDPIDDLATTPDVSAVEEAGTLQPGQIVPGAGEVMAQTDPANAGAEVQPVPNVGAYEPNALLDGNRVINLDLPETLPVIQLLDLVGKYMNLTYLYDPSQITGEVTLKLNGNLQGEMTVRDLYLLLESVLKFKGLAMTRHKDNVVNIVPVSESLPADPRLVSSADATLQPGDVVVMQMFELEHISTTSAKNLLDSMRLSIDVTPIAERGMLIVTAYAYRMGRIDQLLEMVDKPGRPREYRYRQLRYTMARPLADKVQALAEQLESVSVTVAASEAEPVVSTGRRPDETATEYAQRVARERALQAQRRTASTAGGAEGDVPVRQGVYLDADERTNRILMIGLEDQLRIVDGLITSLDVEQQDLRTLKLYRLEFISASEAGNKLAELGIIGPIAETRNSSRITPRTGTPNAANPAAAAAANRAAQAAAGSATVAAEFTEEGPVEQPQVVVIESTNALLVNATAEQHVKIEETLGYVDSEMLATENPYRIYPLANSSPEHLADVLQSLIDDTTASQDAEGRVQTVVTQREEIRIVPDANTYSLIVYASPKNQNWISGLVSQLDRRRPQVLIDVTLVEITQTDQFNYDLNIIQSFPDLNATSGLMGPIAGSVTSATILEKLLESGRSQFAEYQWGGDQFSAFYGDQHINALLTAMQSKNYGRILAKPKILVNDNQMGLIKTTDTTYVEKRSSIPISGGAGGNNTDLIETAIDYVAYDAGLELQITPHISEGELLRLNVSLVRSDFKPTASADKPPDTTASEINSDVTVPDGSTVILGGLIRLNQNKGGRKVPLLGDLPLLGGLFRSTNNSDNQNKLYIFVKAEVIRPDQSVAQGRDELERLSERNRLAFERHEAEFQAYQSWPGVTPRPLDPPTVLDAQ